MLLFWGLFSLQMTGMLAVLQGIIRLDPQAGIKIDREAICILLAGSGTGAGYIVCCHSDGSAAVWIGYLVLALYLTVCAVTDRQTCMVYDFLQLPAAAAGAAMALRCSLPPESGAGLIVFALLQYFVFMRMYGKGDGMAFQICGLYIVGGGGGLEILLLHMALAFGLLGIIQLFRRNLNKRGNLKVPVPFLSYIACTVLWFL